MTQEVKSPIPSNKKLFEWDKDNRMMKLVLKDKLYLCKLKEDNDFTCVSETIKTRKRNNKPN